MERRDARLSPEGSAEAHDGPWYSTIDSCGSLMLLLLLFCMQMSGGNEPGSTVFRVYHN